MGSIFNGDLHPAPLSPTQSVTSTKSRPDTPSLSSYTSIAIWSRRPGDPSKAPGIIISPRAQPPQDIMSKALDLPTPPASPPKSLPPALPSNDYAQERIEDKTDPTGTTLVNSTISSSAVTEATDVPTLPGSPLSTNTSVSGVDGQLTKENIAGAPLATSINEQTTLSDIKTLETSKPSSTATTVSAATVIKTPSAKPLTPKLWASLFSSPSTSSTGASASSLSPRTGLPTSSVVGFSIPASATNPSVAPVVPVIPAKKSELLNLLTNGPGGSGMDKIRTRGLINSGNMCFANAVLQVLVYCAPFQRLFIELGKTLVSQEQQQTSTPSASALPPAAGSSSSGVTVVPNSARPQMNGTTTPKSGKSQTPFIDATVEFLKEFIVEEEGSGSGKKTKKNKDGFTNRVNGRSGGKGKEKEIAEVDSVDGNGDGTDGDDWPESFLPSYVYDAMKEKKRFESMRGGQQEDAEEFLGFYLDTLEEELLSIQNSLAPSKTAKQPEEPHPVEEKEEPEPPEEDGWLEVGKKNRTIITRTIKAVESPITRMFGGKFKSTLKAPGQKDSVLVEDWRSLRLDIQPESIHTIQEALAQITHPQSIQMTHSSRPGITIDANQKVLIEALPPVLVLHVKRFWYDIAVGGVVKVMKQVRFEPELEIGNDMVVPGKRPTKYRLFGAIYHHGHSASGGHYTLDILHQNRYPGAKIREGWIRIDDELVSDVRSEDVFDAWEKDEMRNAYLLFYRRIRS